MSQNLSGCFKDLVITCIKGEGKFLKFWALPISNLDTVKIFESHLESLKQYFESSKGFDHTDQIPLGLKCVVKSKNKQYLWCRAVALAHKEYNTVLVRLLDYGNDEVVLVSDIRNFDDPIMSTQPQAIQFVLADIMPVHNEWTIETIKFCEQHLLFKSFSFYVVSEYKKLLVVRVAKKSITEVLLLRLINESLALIQRKSVLLPPVQLPYKENKLQLNSKHFIRVSYFENAHKFYVQLSPAEMELKLLMDSINRLPKDSLEPLKLPTVNTPCLTRLPTKNFYYRGLITHTKKNQCKVFFVDYGFSEQIDIDELRAIPPTFLNLASQCICCSLPRESDIDSEEIKRLVGYEHLELLAVSHASESYIVKLFFHGQDLLMSLQAAQTFAPQNLNINTQYEVCVSYVNNVSEFYCQLTNMNEYQNIICNILNSGYNFLPLFLNECTPGKPVCAKSSEDNLWYRASIIKVNHDKDIEIFFVDFGNSGNANLSDLRKIGSDLLKIPVQAFKCFLYKTSLPTDSKAQDDAFDLMEQLTCGQNLLAYINTLTGDTGYGITLYIKNSSLTVNEKIFSAIMSLPVVPVDNIEDVFVTSFDSSTSFFVQFEKIDYEKLTNMQEGINTFYSGMQSNMFVPQKGILVCARFNVDGLYYRARVEKYKDGECDLFFVDYGNRASVPMRDVQVMDRKFAQYPQFGTECAFENFSSRVPNKKLSEVMLENSFKMKMIRKDDDKWYVLPVEKFSRNAALSKLVKQFEGSSESTRQGLDKLSENFRDLLNDKESCDVTLKVMHKEYKAHRSVLIARSSVFAATFKHNTLEKKTGVITISDCDPDSFRMFLEYLYSGQVEELSFSTSQSLYYTSDKYNVQELVKLCVEYLMQCLTVENVCEIAVFADNNDEPQLFHAAKDFFIKNSFKILFTSEWEDLTKNDYRLANNLLREMAKVKLND